MRAYWTAKAINRLHRLQQVHDYLGHEQPLSLLFVERLTELARAAADDPYAGVPVALFPGEDIREIVDGAYRFVYRVLPGSIHVLTVRHTAKLLPARR